MNVKTQLFIGFLLMIVVGMASCDTFKDELSPDNYSESSKELDGEWVLTTVTRNGVDITKEMDFSKFHLLLNKDNTYRIENYMPFIVRKNGTWSVDDPVYPYHLTFKEEGAASEQKTEINYLISKGRRCLTITLSPGCPSNIYVYSFEKMSN